MYRILDGPCSNIFVDFSDSSSKRSRSKNAKEEWARGALAAIAVPLEVEPQLEDVVVEVAAEAALVRVLPLAVDDLEGDVLVGRARVEPQHREVRVLGARLLQCRNVSGFKVLLLKLFLRWEYIAICQKKSNINKHWTLWNYKSVLYGDRKPVGAVSCLARACREASHYVTFAD